MHQRSVSSPFLSTVMADVVTELTKEVCVK